MVDVDDQLPLKKKWNLPLFVFFKDARSVFKLDKLGLEILKIALPAALALAADPIASLIDTAFIGHLGPVQLAGVGVAIAVFNQASKITIYPLVSITTSFVAEEDTVKRLAEEASTEANLVKLIPKDVTLQNLEEDSASSKETKDMMPEEEKQNDRKLSAEALKKKNSVMSLGNIDIKNLLLEEVKLDNLEKGSAASLETKELMTGKEEGPDGKLRIEALKEVNSVKSSANNDTKNLLPEDVALDNLEKGSASSTETKELMAGNGSDKKLSAEALKEENSEKSSASNDTKNLLPEMLRLITWKKVQRRVWKKNELMAKKSYDLRLEASIYKCSPVAGSIVDKGKPKHKKRHIASASTALLLGCVLGILQTLFLIFLAKPLLSIMGIKSGSPMLIPAHKYLTIRSLGAPAVLQSLAMQGIFRGFKDTTTALYATAAGDLLNIILDPILIFVCHLGVSGAAIAHVLSQYFISLILFLKLMREVDLLPPSPKDLQLSRFLRSGTLLLARVVAVTFCVTLAASLAARLGPTPMAAFQVCLQVWMASSLLADGLAVAGQAILACAFAEKDYAKTTATAARVLQMCVVMGLGLALVVGLGMHFGSGIFTKDKNVIAIISVGLPFIAVTQPINSLAFVFDGVNFGASDFAYSAFSMVVVAAVSVASLFLLSKSNGFVGIWIALTIYMVLRAVAGIWRMGTGTGPWRYLRG